MEFDFHEELVMKKDKVYRKLIIGLFLVDIILISISASIDKKYVLHRKSYILFILWFSVRLITIYFKIDLNLAIKLINDKFEYIDESKRR